MYVYAKEQPRFQSIALHIQQLFLQPESYNKKGPGIQVVPQIHCP